MPLNSKFKAARTVMGLATIFLLIELLDELVDGVRGAALPLIRSDLHLSYVQIGMLLTVPNTIGSLIEPILGIWADLGQRRKLILSGGVAFAIALLLISLSHNFSMLLAGFVLFNPASGSFVSLSQATLMDLEPNRHEQNMARWVLAGSLGNVVGPLILAASLILHQSWRGAFFVLAVFTGFPLALLWHSRWGANWGTNWGAKYDWKGSSSLESPPAPTFSDGIRNAIAALKRLSVLRWLMLLECSDLMLDVLRGFIALYFVDVVGASNTQASIALTVWLGFGLMGDVLLIPLLERMQGLRYLRVSAVLVLVLYPAFLIAASFTVKLVILAGLGLLNAGWYSILKGQLYKTMPGQSGTVMTLSNVFGLVGGFTPLLLGVLAQQVGLHSTMWVLLAAPIALLVGLPKA